MDADEKVDIDKELSAIEERAKTRRRRSVFATLVPVALTGLAVLVFARDIDKKRGELSAVEGKKREVESKLDAQRKELDEATRAGQELEKKIGRLRDEKKDLEDYLRGLRSTAPEGAARKAEGPESVVLEGEGKAPEGLQVIPRARVTPRASGRAMDVVLSLEVPEGQTNPIKSVVYELNPVYYFMRRELEGGPAPSFEATVTVYACKSTVLAKITLEGGARLDVDFDWCRAEGWPAAKPEQVVEPPPEQEQRTPRPTFPPRPPTAPGDTPPRR